MTGPATKRALRLACAGLLVCVGVLGLLATRPDNPLGAWLRTTGGLRTATAPHAPSELRRTAAKVDAPWPTTLPELVFTPLNPHEAKALNDSVPFSVAPIEPAAPFKLPITKGDTQTSPAVQCLTQAIYYEAGLEPLEGQEAVAQVVLNRVRHPLFPKSVCGVVYQGASLRTGCQFTFTCDGSFARAPDPKVWSEAKRVAEGALSGFVMAKVGTATHYHADYVAPYWLNSLVKLQQIGAHIFYKWPGAAGRVTAFTGRYAGPEVDPSAPVLAIEPDPPPIAARAAQTIATVTPAEVVPVTTQTASVELVASPVIAVPSTSDAARTVSAPSPEPSRAERQVPAIVRSNVPCLNPMAGCTSW